MATVHGAPESHDDSNEIGSEWLVNIVPPYGTML